MKTKSENKSAQFDIVHSLLAYSISAIEGGPQNALKPHHIVFSIYVIKIIKTYISKICTCMHVAAGLAHTYISESPTCVSLISWAYLSVENSTNLT